MRVIGGKYRGKKLLGSDIDGTRPTMDRVKESLFGMIQNYIPNSICLDLFAGSGSLGIEALSNGAAYCYFVDKYQPIFKILEHNLIGIDNNKIIKKDYKKALLEINKTFDIIFLDPPYHENLITPSIKIILENNLLNKDGIIVCEFIEEEINCDLKLIKEKKYGNKTIRIYKNELI